MAENDLMTPVQADALVSTELPTNHNEDLTATNARTAIRTSLRAACGCYGMLLFQNVSPGVALSILAASYLDFTSWSNVQAQDGYTFSAANGTITVTTASAGDAIISFHVTLARNAAYTTAGGNFVFVKLAKNATELTTRVVSTSGTGDTFEISGQFHVAGLVNGDVIKLQYAGDQNAVNGLQWLAGDLSIERRTKAA